MTAKFFVYGGGRWREVDLLSGCVSGWGPAKFVSVQRGKLVAARRRRVLRALSALAERKPSLASDGPRLSVYRNENEDQAIVNKKKSVEQLNNCCCRLVHHGCNDVAQPAPIQLPAIVPRLNVTVDASTQVVDSAGRKVVTQAEVYTEPGRKRKYTDTSDSDVFSKVKKQTVLDNNAGNKVIRRHSDSSDSRIITITNNISKVKELLIGEEDIMILRSCIERNVLFPEVDLERFDSSDTYKSSVFYRLNPLVNVERSTEIKRLLSEKDKYEDNLSLDQFVKHLGLRSVNDVKEAKRYKTRNTIVRSPKKLPLNDIQYRESTSSDDNISLKKYKNTQRDKRKSYDNRSSSSDMDKENFTANKPQVKLRRNRKGRFLKASQSKATTKISHRDKKPRLSTEVSDSDINETAKRLLRDRSIVISDSDEEKTITKDVETTVNEKRESKRLSQRTDNDKELTKETSALFFKKRSGSPIKRVVSKVSKINVQRSRKNAAYSPSEDAAIVRWVRGVTSRARRVNGNRLWRQLEAEYHQLTQTTRSWHSLRNRYLRGILPALHRMPLSGAGAAELRAAAAHGELKHRKQPPGRHSLFPAPPVGASSRLPPSKVVSSPPRFPPRHTRRSHRLDQPNDQSIDKPVDQPIDQPVDKSIIKSALKQKDGDSSPTYSELTRRFALRVRSTPNDSKEGSPNKSVRFEDQKPRTRRLYNPK